MFQEYKSKFDPFRVRHRYAKHNGGKKPWPEKRETGSKRFQLSNTRPVPINPRHGRYKERERWPKKKDVPSISQNETFESAALKINFGSSMCSSNF